MMEYLQRYKLTLLGIAAGAGLGYLYYYYVGCASGSCMITSRPLNSTLYGALMGGLFLSSFQKEKKDSTRE
ncbi:MAG: DUF6132 family protein [Haliscomenobacter sp.]